MDNKRQWTVPGIPDDQFVRGNVPMTKEEVRTLTVAKMRLDPDSIVLDIGAGTGSLAIECALLAPRGKVFAVEKNPAGIEVIRQNAVHFGVKNFIIIEGEAPQCLEGLPALDAVVVGGSGGNMPGIIAKVAELLKPGGRLVINAVLLETLMVSLSALKKGVGWGPVGLLNVSVARGKELGGGTAFQPQNPVFILWTVKDRGSIQV